MFMTFGKYKGWEITDLPESYAIWLLNNVDLDPTLQRALEAHLGIQILERRLRRLQEEYKQWRERGSIGTDLIASWQRKMAQRFHPDVGGSHEAMKAVNAGYELLLDLVQSHGK